MLNDITPVILTFNESANIARTLSKLTWARRIVVVDSESTDGTLSIVESFPQTSVFVRPIVTLAEQWNFGVHQTGIETNWIFRLDADYVIEDELISEIELLNPSDEISAYCIGFKYCVFGVPLRASLYPSDYKLFRRKSVTFFQDGHTERPKFEGRSATLKGNILHDDRKSIGRWLWSQDRYMAAEAKKLCDAPLARLDFVDRLRKQTLLGPISILLYCLFRKGLIFEGRPGLYYSLQRTIAEMILVLKLLELKYLNKE